MIVFISSLISSPASDTRQIKGGRNDNIPLFGAHQCNLTQQDGERSGRIFLEIHRIGCDSVLIIGYFNIYRVDCMWSLFQSFNGPFRLIDSLLLALLRILTDISRRERMESIL